MLWATISILLTMLGASKVRAKEIGPDEDLCRAINDPASGDEVVLRPGEYRGPCMIRRDGAADRPLVIRAQDPGHRPHIGYDGESANVLEIRADHVVVTGLSFGPTRKNVDGVRIRAGKDVAVIDCEFVKMGGIAVAANQSSLQGLLVSQNIVSLSNATAMYFGCHDGTSCRLSNLVIEKNQIDGVAAADNEVGYGIEVKLNSTAVIRENIVRDTKGPGIMIYGARDAADESVIERNFVSGSRTSSGIVLGGGPAIVRNNIASFNSVGGIGLEDYGQRGLLRGIKIGFNSVYGNASGGVTAPAPGKLADTMLVANVGWNHAPAPVFPPSQAGLVESDNLNCDRACFAEPEDDDFSPARNTALDLRRVAFKGAWRPEDDFFGHRRNSSPKIGAVETAGRPPDRRLSP